MASSMIRIRPGTHDALREIAELTGQSLQDSLDQAIEERRRRLYLERVNADYAALQQDPKAAADHQADLDAWSTTNSDGLEDL